MNNYPPGVTGNEFEIAGPDFEDDYDENCPECGAPMTLFGYRHERWIQCTECNYGEILDE